MLEKNIALEVMRRRSTMIGAIFLLILLVSSFSLRNQDFRKVTGAANLEATYHVLLTTHALENSPFKNHWGLPTVTLGTSQDKDIPWGLTQPTRTGDYIYTSFSAPGFMVPYLVLDAVGARLSEKNLARFNSVIGAIVSIVLYALLVRILRSAAYTPPVAVAGALAGTAVSIFSREVLQSHGVIYWVHSFYQLILVVCLYFVFAYLNDQATGNGNRKRYGACLLAAVFLGAWTEWTGYVFGIGIAALFWLKGKHDRSSRTLSVKLFLAVVAAGLVTVIHLSLGVGFEPALRTLAARFMARNTSTGSLTGLLGGYGLSFGLFILIVFSALAVSFFKNNKKHGENPLVHERIGFLFLASTIPLVENLLMLQHADQFSFDRLKFVFPIAIVICLSFARSAIAGRIVLVLAVCLASAHGYRSYKASLTEHAYWAQADMLNRSLVDAVSRATDLKCAVLLSNLGVRGYANILLGRGMYEYKSRDESRQLMDQRKACSAVYLEGDWIYSDLPRYKRATLTRSDGTIVEFQSLDIGATAQDFFLTDSNWVQGIARHFPGFFVPNTDAVRTQLAPGAEVVLANGEVRKVVKAEVHPPYLNVYLDGPNMQVQSVGKPDSFVVRRILDAAKN
jgi:hypothetical protein